MEFRFTKNKGYGSFEKLNGRARYKRNENTLKIVKSKQENCKSDMRRLRRDFGACLYILASCSLTLHPTYLPIYQSNNQSIDQAIHRSSNQSIPTAYLSAFMPACLSISLSVYVHIDLCACLRTCLSTCLLRLSILTERKIRNCRNKINCLCSSSFFNALHCTAI